MGWQNTVSSANVGLRSTCVFLWRCLFPLYCSTFLFSLMPWSRKTSSEEPLSKELLKWWGWAVICSPGRLDIYLHLHISWSNCRRGCFSAALETRVFCIWVWEKCMWSVMLVMRTCGNSFYVPLLYCIGSRAPWVALDQGKGEVELGFPRPDAVEIGKPCGCSAGMVAAVSSGWMLCLYNGDLWAAQKKTQLQKDWGNSSLVR